MPSLSKNPVSSKRSSGSSKSRAASASGRERMSSGSSRSVAAATTSTKNTTTSCVTMDEQKYKGNFLMFTQVLMKYLEQRDQEMHARARAIIKECYENNKIGDPNYLSLTTSMSARLRATVGDVYWKKAQAYLNHYKKKKHDIVSDGGSTRSTTNATHPPPVPGVSVSKSATCNLAGKERRAIVDLKRHGQMRRSETQFGPLDPNCPQPLNHKQIVPSKPLARPAMLENSCSEINRKDAMLESNLKESYDMVDSNVIVSGGGSGTPSPPPAIVPKGVVHQTATQFTTTPSHLTIDSTSNENNESPTTTTGQQSAMTIDTTVFTTSTSAATTLNSDEEEATAARRMLAPNHKVSCDKLDSNIIIIKPKKDDIMCGHSSKRKNREHPGNIALRNYIEAKKAACNYKQLETNQKRDAIDETIGNFKYKCRFLVFDSVRRGYVEADQNRIRKKVKHIFNFQSKIGTIFHPNDTDILQGRGHEGDMHPGNVALQRFIDEKKTTCNYERLNSSAKKALIDETVAHFHAIGRLLVYNPLQNSYTVECDQSILRLKVKDLYTESRNEKSYAGMHGAVSGLSESASVASHEEPLSSTKETGVGLEQFPSNDDCAGTKSIELEVQTTNTDDADAVVTSHESQVEQAAIGYDAMQRNLSQTQMSFAASEDMEMVNGKSAYSEEGVGKDDRQKVGYGNDDSDEQISAGKLGTRLDTSDSASKVNDEANEQCMSATNEGAQSSTTEPVTTISPLSFMPRRKPTDASGAKQRIELESRSSFNDGIDANAASHSSREGPAAETNLDNSQMSAFGGRIMMEDEHDISDAQADYDVGGEDASYGEQDYSISDEGASYSDEADYELSDEDASYEDADHDVSDENARDGDSDEDSDNEGDDDTNSVSSTKSYYKDLCARMFFALEKRKASDMQTRMKIKRLKEEIAQL